MNLPDVNVLIHAFRADSPRHSLCRRWLSEVLESSSRFAISPQVLSSVMRVVTHRKSFSPPSEPEDVLNFCTYLLQSPNCQVVRPGERHWDIFTRLCIESDARGNLVPDAWFAALAIEWGCEWITFDRDFARFPGLKWSVPS